MSKISELGTIKGANTRSEDLFVIVNLIQGDDGTKNITRKELVAAIQYEIFDRITITGGNISGVRIFNSTIEDNIMNRNTFNDGTIDSSSIIASDITGGTMKDTAVSNVSILTSDFTNGTGNNNVFTNTIVDFGALNNSTGNNDVFTNSTIDDSFYNRVTIEGGTANNLILTNITIDELILEDALISNSVIITTDFSNGSISDSTVANVAISDSSFANGNIRDTDLDNVNITNSRFSNGEIWDTILSNNTIITTVITDSTFSNGAISDSTANNITITNSDFSNGTGTDNTFTNPILENAILTGAMNSVIATNISIGSSTSEDLIQQRSSIKNSDISESVIANSTINESELVDFDMNLTKVFEPMLDEDSYFALKNVKTGDTEKMTYRQLYDEFSKKTEKSLKVHVASDGNDDYPGTILQPVRTLKRAEQLALQKAGGSYDRNDINNAVHISVGPGTYYVDEPIVLPDDCSMTSTAGQYATVIQKLPGYEKTNGVLVGSGNYVQGFGYMNFEVDNFDQPEGGFAIAYRPGALLRRSPYIRDSTQLSNFNRLDVEPPLNPFNTKGTILDLGQEFYLVAGHSPQSQFEVDDEVTFSSGATGYVSYVLDIDSARQIYIRNLKGNVEIGDILYAQRGGTGTIESIGIDDFPNRLVGRGGGCLLADRAVLDTDSLYTYVLCFGFTPRTQNGTGYVAKNGAGVNGIGSLSIFTRQAFFALDGGQMTLNNSGSQFGDISMRARGSTVIIRPANATQVELIADNTFADTLEASKDLIIDNMVDYLTANTTTGFNGAPGLGYQGYNADKCFRDSGLIVDSASYDVATDGNYWGRLNGITYRSPISYIVVNDQMTETVGSINHIKGEINHIFAQEQNAEVLTRLDRSLDQTLNILQNGEAAADPIIFADTGDQDAVAAREVVQDNRSMIIDEFVSWIDNNEEFYAYDSVKCERDIQEYILPATKFDMMLDTNYNAVTTGLAYYVNTARTTLENQRNETVASFERLRKTTDNLIQANSAPAAVDAYKSFNTIINALNNSGTKYTPTKATYDAATGRMVITIGTHDLTVGRYVNLAKESFTFKCSSDNYKTEISHPRVSEKAYLAALPIIEVSAKTITVNPGLTAANYEHVFVSALDNAVSVIGEQITFSDNANIAVTKRNARKQLQVNREFIQDYMMCWVDDEFYFYDSKKCHRDTEQYILPAVQRDLMLGTNYNSIQTGAAYRTKSGEVSVTDQLIQTVGSINYLKSETAALLTNTIAEDRANQAFDEMTRLLNNNGKKYTPTNAVYSPASGTTVITIGSHDFNIGDSIYLEPNSLTFTCALDSNATEHTYPTTTFIKYTPTGATYDPATGEFSATIGANALKAGDLVEFKPSSIVFTCTMDNNVTNHPAPESHHPFYKKQIVIDRVEGTTIYMNVGGVTNGGGVHTFVSAATNAINAEKRHPAYKKPVVISDRDATTITINVGESSDTSVHTFVSATANAVREADMWEGKFTPQTATYDPVSGDMVLTIGSHDLPVGKWIQIAPESMIFSCDVGGVTGTDAAPLYDHPAYKEPVRVKAATADTITVNVGNANGHANNHTFVSAEVDCIDANALYFADPAKVLKSFTPTDATYDPVTGVFVVTIAGHGLTTDDHIELQPQSFVFSCAANGGGNDFSPRIGDYAYKLPLKIDSVTTDTITVNCGSAGTNTDVHTFVSADEGAVVKVSSTTQGVYASRILQKNKAYLQAEVTAWLDNNYYTYSKAKCERDTGIILNAVARDVVTGSNVNAIYTGKGYRIGTVGANNLVNTQLVQTTGAITWLKGKINTDVIANATSISRSDAAFDEIIDIMTNGNANADELYFGEEAVSSAHRMARGALQANRTFIQKEIVAWITANYPTFTYNTVACERDMGIFVDLASWDIQHGSNAATASNAKLYFENAIPVLSDNEVVPTSEAYFFAADLIGKIVRNEVVTALNVTNTQTIVETTTFTPTDATYDPATGDFVMTIAGHGMKLNDRVTLDPNSFAFTCAMDGDNASKTYPRGGIDQFANKTYSIKAKTTNTVTLDAGASGPNKYFTPSAADYNASTGDMVVTVGQHGLGVGRNVVLENNSFTFTCDQDANVTQHTYPRAGSDPYAGASITITAVGSTGHTPTNTDYNPTTGDTVLTVASHGFSNGDYVLLEDSSLTYTCVLDGNRVSKSYPRAGSDYASGRWLQVSDVTTNTFKVNVGPSSYRGAHTFISATTNAVKRQDGTFTINVGDAGTASGSVHTFVSATTDAIKHEPQSLHTFVSVAADAVKVANMAEAYTPAGIDYNHITGVMVMTLGSHALTENDYVIFDENAITLSCASNGGGNLSHPRPTDPIFNKPVRVDATTATTITLQVGPAKIDAVHTFVSATANGVRRSIKPSVAAEVEKLFYDLGDTIRKNDGTIAAISEPRIESLTSAYAPAIIADYKAINGQAPKYQTEIIKYISETYNGLGYDEAKCPRDVGYIVDAISEDLEYGGDVATVHSANYYYNGAMSVLEPYSMLPTKLAFNHIADVVEKVVKNVVNEPIFGDRFTPTNATYDTATGILVATIGTHTLTTDDYIWFTPDAITFSCDTGSGPTNHASPEAHHRFYNKACPVIGVTSTTITLWVGGFAGGTAHTFVSALTDGFSQINGNLVYQNVALPAADAATGTEAKRLTNVIAEVVDDRLVIPGYTGSLDISVGQQTPYPLPIANPLTAPLMEPSRTYARKSLQWNREFIQEEVVRFVKDNNYTYDEAKCARDVGFIIDAIARDVQTGSDYPSQYYGRAYRVGTALANNVITEQLAETVEAIEYVQADILARLTGTALTRATAAFTNVINIMKNGTAGITYNFGAANVGSSDSSATTGLILNQAFLQEEAIKWIAVNHGSLVYDEAKCRRDVGFLIEAVAFDIRHGSNVGVRDFAKLYFENGINVGLPLAQRAPTAELYAHLGVVAEKVVLKQAVTPSTGNVVAQVTSGFGNVVGSSGVEVEALITIVKDIIAEDSLINLPQAREAAVTDGAATGYDQEASVAIILGRKDALGGAVVQYLSDNFAFLQYSEERCRRDTGYIVDAISHDIQYGGNSAMHATAELYFKNAVNILPIDQRQATREAFEYMGKVVQHVIRNEAVPRKVGKQFSPSTASYDPDTGIFTATLGSGHNLNVGDYVQIAPNSIVFTCSLDGDVALHPSPQANDPYYNAPNIITARSATTITLQVGKVPYGRGGGAHTFVSASVNAISHIIGNPVKQEMPTLAARRTIAAEAMNLTLMLAKVADDNNPGAIPARVEPFINWIDADMLAEKHVIDNATVQMATNLQTYIYNTYNGISYSREKCRRDVGTMIDAISHDVNYSTNYATIRTAELYFVNAISILPADQRQQTAKFYTEMANTIGDVVVGNTVNTTILGHSSASQDSTTYSAATSVEQEEVKDLVRIVEDAIRRDSIDAIPSIVEPNTSWVEASRVWAGQAIDDNLSKLSDDITQFLKDTFTIIDYSKAKCRRDAGYILDAMSWDLNYGGNLATRWNANFYFWNNELRVPEDTRVATAQAYRQLGKIVSQVVLGEYPGQTIRTELGTEVQSTQADELGMIFYNALFYNNVNKLGQTKLPNFAWETNRTFKFAKDILTNNKIRIQREVQRFITSEYKFIDLPKTYRDGGNFLKLIQNDFRFEDPVLGPIGGDRASRSFVGALFNINAQHVFPVFNPPATFTNWRKLRFKGTLANATIRDALTAVANHGVKRWDAYIIPTNNTTNRYIGDITYWTGTVWTAPGAVGANNTDLLDAFIGAWTQMKTYINNNIATDQPQRDMVTELIDNVIIDSVIRPDFLVFGSLVESIAHQFNGASAGVNRNALPLNFRNVGAAIGANASVLSENGGRIRWSGSDELNNQYFARGLKINGRTGRIEGRPFTSSVRKLARRASNSRASL